MQIGNDDLLAALLQLIKGLNADHDKLVLDLHFARKELQHKETEFEKSKLASAELNNVLKTQLFEANFKYESLLDLNKKLNHEIRSLKIQNTKLSNRLKK